MKLHWGIALVMATAAVVAAASAVPAQQAAYTSQGFTPGFDDLMTLLIQPRHVRLYFAGKAENWELAASEARNLRSSFDRVAMAITNYQGSDVAQAIAGLVKPGMDAADAAIGNADPVAFKAAYQQITEGCNQCHMYMEHPYLVIKVPDGAVDTAHPDQDYAPVP